MNLLLIAIMFFQVVGTPIVGGSVILSSGFPVFPDLPDGIEPIAINDDWELLYYRVLIDSDQYIIDGEIRNTTDDPLETTEIVVETLDGLRFGVHPDVGSVQAGGRAPFHDAISEDEIVSSLNNSTELVFPEACEYYSVIPLQEPEWEFTDVEIEWDSDRGAVNATGTVENLGPGKIESVEPILFGFTPDGYYTGSFGEFDGSRVFRPGEPYEFEIDYGFSVYSSSSPFAAADEEVQFVLAMSSTAGAWISCA